MRRRFSVPYKEFTARHRRPVVEAVLATQQSLRSGLYAITIGLALGEGDEVLERAGRASRNPPRC